MSSYVPYTMNYLSLSDIKSGSEPVSEPEPEPENNSFGPWITDDNASDTINSVNQYIKYRRYIQVSGSEFSGFIHEIDIRYVDNLEDIVRITKDKLKEIFDKHNMIDLSSDVENIDFHIHSHTFDDILLMDSKDTIYVCNCNCN